MRRKAMNARTCSEGSPLCDKLLDRNEAGILAEMYQNICAGLAQKMYPEIASVTCTWGRLPDEHKELLTDTVVVLLGVVGQIMSPQVSETETCPLSNAR
jgi:hypothetical protein